MTEANRSSRAARFKSRALKCLALLITLALLLASWRAAQASLLSGGRVTGEIRLQGRMDPVEVEVQMETLPPETEAQSSNPFTTLQAVRAKEPFSFAAQGVVIVTARRPGYLDAQAQATVSVEETVNLGPTTLYGGEVTDDNLIDIADLAYLGANYHTADARGDINGDGTVDILDLAPAAANFKMRGPTDWGR